MEAVEVAFDAAAEALMLRYNVKASTLQERMRNITEGATKDLPPLQVLYCNPYGEYSYSEEFESFVEAREDIPDSLATICAVQFGKPAHYGLDYDSSNHGCYDNRVRHVRWIAPFGQHIMEKWPGIGKLVKAYMMNDLGQRMNDISDIAWREAELRRYLEISKAIATKKGRKGGKKKYNLDSSELKNFGDYSPAALKAMRRDLDAEQSKFLVEIQEQRHAVLKHMTEAQYAAMLQSRATKFPEEKVKGFEGHCDMDLMSFIEAIEQYGEHHYAVWDQFQAEIYFDRDAMRFLLLHPEYTEQLASEEGNVDCAQNLGLCAAGGLSCTLHIAEVTRTMEWEVDVQGGGWETIRYV